MKIFDKIKKYIMRNKVYSTQSSIPHDIEDLGDLVHLFNGVKTYPSTLK